MELEEFIAARLDEEAAVIAESLRALPTAPEESGAAWPDFEHQIDRRGHSAISISPLRADWDYTLRLRMVEVARRLSAHEDPSVQAAGRGVLLAVVQAYSDHPGFDPRWLIGDGGLIVGDHGIGRHWLD